MKRIILAAILPFAAFGLACGIGGSGQKATPTPSTHTLHGTISVTGDEHYYRWSLGEPCSGSGGFDDMAAGTQVVINDGSGSTIATGHLNEGTGANPYIDVGGTPDPEIVDTCLFSFDVEGIRDSDFYSVEVSHRGAMTYSKAEMESNGWTLALSLD